MPTHAGPKPAGTPTWVDLMAPDIEAARSFYQNLFGWEYEIGGPEYGGYSNARMGAHLVAGIGGSPPGAPPMPAAWGVYFASHDLAADVARAVGLGATVLTPPMQIDSYGGMAICADPLGAPFGFWQAGNHTGAQLTDEPGAAAWYELYAPNAEQARDFYAALLGATAERMPGEFTYYVLKHGDEQLCGIMQRDPSDGALPAQWLTYFAVTNADDAVATVKRLGGTVDGPIEDSPFGRFVGVADPSGALFKIIEAPAG